MTSIRGNRNAKPFLCLRHKWLPHSMIPNCHTSLFLPINQYFCLSLHYPSPNPKLILPPSLPGHWVYPRLGLSYWWTGTVGFFGFKSRPALSLWDNAAFNEGVHSTGASWESFNPLLPLTCPAQTTHKHRKRGGSHTLSYRGVRHRLMHITQSSRSSEIKVGWATMISYVAFHLSHSDDYQDPEAINSTGSTGYR